MSKREVYSGLLQLLNEYASLTTHADDAKVVSLGNPVVKKVIKTLRTENIVSDALKQDAMRFGNDYERKEFTAKEIDQIIPLMREKIAAEARKGGRRRKTRKTRRHTRRR